MGIIIPQNIVDIGLIGIIFLVQFSCSVVSDSLRSSLSITNSQSTPKPMSLCWWCHQNISSSFFPISPFPQSFPPSGSFQMSQLYASGGQTIGASASVLPMNIQDWFPLGWTGWISLQSKGLSRVSSNTTVQNHQFFGAQFLYSPTLTSIHVRFSRQEYWHGLPFPSPGDIPNPGIEPRSPALQASEQSE